MEIFRSKKMLSYVILTFLSVPTQCKIIIFNIFLTDEETHEDLSAMNDMAQPCPLALFSLLLRRG